jgi:hypothetical protein
MAVQESVETIDFWVAGQKSIGLMIRDGTPGEKLGGHKRERETSAWSAGDLPCVSRDDALFYA